MTDPAARRARVAEIFDRAAATYENVGVPWFGPIAAGLVAAAAPAPGERVLDVGCGTGEALVRAAAAAGPAGRVTGIDLAPGMVAASRAAASALDGAAPVDVAVMDAAVPDLPAASFDLVLASLVIFFLPDPAAALSAWRDLLVPGGRLAMSTFGPRDPVWEALDAVFRPYLPPDMLDARTSGERGPFASDEGVAGLVAGAGYRDVATSRFDVEVTFADAAQWQAWTLSHGQRVLWEAVPEADRPAVLAAAAERLEGARDGDALRLRQGVRITRATRPA